MKPAIAKRNETPEHNEFTQSLSGR
ncbi:protein of unknown function [Azospirillum baldaniorum]|uniref:Uncharacterized protein n=1 Tax=Azospirillum baldaniorum TaxID=1064539 RepID=A0A9P1JS15_9PROT|nr:protein of unknown function [Azospirillum baldaniorum]